MIYKTKPAYMATFMLAILLSGCNRYGTVSASTYEISKSLYSICNRQDAKAIETVKKVIEERHAAEEITYREQQWLLDIVQTATTGEWSAAMQDARTMMMEQVDD